MTDKEVVKYEMIRKSNGGRFTSETAAEAGKRSSREGVPNAHTSESRETVKMIIEGNWKKLKEELEKLEGKDYVNSVIKLLEFHLPKLNKVEVKDDLEDKRMTINVNYSDVDLESDEMK